MRPLPALATGRGRLILPMADRSAWALVDVLLAADPGQADLLAEQLAADPPLVLWGVCVNAQREARRPRSLSDLAIWLGRHAREVLQWPGEAYTWGESSGVSQADHYADRIAHLLQVAEIAALLAASDGQAAAEEAFLIGLLHEAPQWFAPAGDEAGETLPACLPDWLVSETGTLAALRAAAAVHILAGRSSEVPPEFDAEECRQRAMEARQAWLEPIDGAVDRLPVLAARLARLDQLEHRFQEALETEKLEAMAEFAAGAGHEINNPLAIIGGRAQLLLKDENDPERRRELALMNAQVKRAHEMIADIRLFGRPPEPEPETVELVELVDRLVSDFRAQAAERAVSLSRSGDDGPLAIEADPAQLNVALRALCRNSLEAIGHDGHVEIALRRLAQHVEIRVSDDGPGIAAEHRRHLFDPFYSARQAGRGLGFGLSKCWRIITNHGGTVEVESQPDQGATFTITLPQRWSEPGRH